MIGRPSDADEDRVLVECPICGVEHRVDPGEETELCSDCLLDPACDSDVSVYGAGCL